jgi:hypothetical protein
MPIKNRVNSTAITNTATTVVKDGNAYVMSFNGTTSKVDCGAYDTLVGNKTVIFLLKPLGYGEGNVGNILNNTKLIVRINSTNSCYQVSSDGATFVSSANNSAVLGMATFLAVTRKSDGKVSIYIGYFDTAPALSGSADQASGTVAAGSNIIIGNNTGQTATWDGNSIDNFIYDGILSLTELTQEFTSLRKYLI